MRMFSRVSTSALAVLAVSALAFAGEARVAQGKVCLLYTSDAADE